MHNLGKNQWKVNNFTSEIKCKLQLNLLFSYFYRWISNTFSELMDGQLSIGFFWRSAWFAWHATRFTLLICWLLDILPTTYVLRIVKTGVCRQMYVSRIHKIFVGNRLKLAFINTIEIVLWLYLFLLQTEVACFVVKSAIVIFAFLLRKSTKASLHL